MDESPALFCTEDSYMIKLRNSEILLDICNDVCHCKEGGLLSMYYPSAV